VLCESVAPSPFAHALPLLPALCATSRRPANIGHTFFRYQRLSPVAKLAAHRARLSAHPWWATLRQSQPQRGTQPMGRHAAMQMPRRGWECPASRQGLRQLSAGQRTARLHQTAFNRQGEASLISHLFLPPPTAFYRLPSLSLLPLPLAHCFRVGFHHPTPPPTSPSFPSDAGRISRADRLSRLRRARASGRALERRRLWQAWLQGERSSGSLWRRSRRRGQHTALRSQSSGRQPADRRAPE